MANAGRKPGEPGRFDYEEVTAEIQAFIDGHPRGTQQRLADAAFPGLAPQHATSKFRHCMQEYRGERFAFEEVGRIAVAAGKLLGRPEGAPSAWPFLAWKDAEAVEGILRAVRGSRS